MIDDEIYASMSQDPEAYSCPSCVRLQSVIEENEHGNVMSAYLEQLEKVAQLEVERDEAETARDKYIDLYHAALHREHAIQHSAALSEQKETDISANWTDMTDDANAADILPASEQEADCE